MNKQLEKIRESLLDLEKLGADLGHQVSQLMIPNGYKFLNHPDVLERLKHKVISGVYVVIAAQVGLCKIMP